MKLDEAIISKVKEGKKVVRKLIPQYILGKDGYGKLVGFTRKMELCPLHLNEDDFEATDWEEFKEEDDWNIKDAPYDTRDPMKGIETLKAKILEDISREVNKNNGMTITGTKYIFDILDKRFGF